MRHDVLRILRISPEDLFPAQFHGIQPIDDGFDVNAALLWAA
jgi:hypothetical protein